MNLQNVADALAGCYTSVTATSKSLETETVTGTADLPNTVSKLALLVYPPVGELNYTLGNASGPKLDDHYIFLVRLLRDPLSVPARTQWLYAWFTALRSRVLTNVDLDTAGVIEAKAIGPFRIELDGESYSSAAGEFRTFDVVELSIDVHLQQLANATI